jgi:peptidoglycan-associated lipoprotein
MPAPSSTCAADADCSGNRLCLQLHCVAVDAAADACGGARRVHFDFDSSSLRDADMPLLDRAARCLRADPQLHLLVAGDADQRGSVRYNLELGERRAREVIGRLEGQGVSSAQLASVSYGKELPLCAERQESCCSRNRRADLLPGGAPRDITRIVRLDERRERLARGRASHPEKVTAASQASPNPERDREEAAAEATDQHWISEEWLAARH